MPCRSGWTPVEKVGQTAPLPISVGERTRAHSPSPCRRRSVGSSPCAIRSRTRRGSAASMPTANTRGPLDIGGGARVAEKAMQLGGVQRAVRGQLEPATEAEAAEAVLPRRLGADRPGLDRRLFDPYGAVERRVGPVGYEVGQKGRRRTARVGPDHVADHRTPLARVKVQERISQLVAGALVVLGRIHHLRFASPQVDAYPAVLIGW